MRCPSEINEVKPQSGLCAEGEVLFYLAFLNNPLFSFQVTGVWPYAAGPRGILSSLACRAPSQWRDAFNLSSSAGAKERNAVLII